MPTSALKRLSWEEYIHHERQATEKSEFYDGELFAMAGGTANHSLVGTNVCREAGNSLKERPCRVHGSDMRILCPTGLGTYPDCSIVCGEPQFLNDTHDTLLNPIVIFEVLSPSTEAYDRGRKFKHYRSLLSLQEYVIVAQDEVRIEHYVRQTDSSQWLLTVVSEPNASLSLPTLDISLSMSEIYAKVTFDLPVDSADQIGEITDPPDKSSSQRR